MVVKKVSVLLSTLLIVGALSGCNASKQDEAKKDIKKIGIAQIVEHPALDSTRKGFIQALKDNNYIDGKNIIIDYQNAQGDNATIQTIAEKFVNDNEDLILAIATPAAQAAYNSTKNANKDIPIVMTAVTDPVKVGIVKSLDKPGTNVTGTSDAAPIDVQLKLIKKVIPSSKKIGILYNTSEVNSEIQVEEAKKNASIFGMEIVAQGITAENEISQSLQSILGKIDVLLTIKDNMIASAMTTITKQSYEKNIPVIGTESAHVKGGALITDGIDFEKLGYETGLKAVEILKGKKPSEIPIEIQKESSVVINKESLNKLNIKLPKDIYSKAKVISGGEK
ncbi:ABC transporter substrate-binding protein [Clostridium rectalis]|uniref:ABC transporter substrate-binding protein n=1 Tax=Clostridium rectalis TaxID=2040295 RepID=UPI000F639D39|nr:ABC transporter substrate-binding protein [Clostridium rectalis]